MKFLVSGFLVLGFVCAQNAKADDLKAFDGFDEKISQMENYTVTWVEPNKDKTILKLGSRVQKRKTSDNLHVKLIRAPKKS